MPRRLRRHARLVVLVLRTCERQHKPEGLLRQWGPDPAPSFPGLGPHPAACPLAPATGLPMARQVACCRHLGAARQWCRRASLAWPRHRDPMQRTGQPTQVQPSHLGPRVAAAVRAMATLAGAALFTAPCHHPIFIRACQRPRGPPRWLLQWACRRGGQQLLLNKPRLRRMRTCIRRIWML